MSNRLQPEHLVDLSEPIQRRCSYGIIVLILLVFAAEFYTPLGFNHGTLYAPLVFLALLCGQRSLLLLAGALSITFNLLGIFISPPAPSDISFSVVLGNRIFATVVIALVTALSVWILHFVGQLKRLNIKLTQEQGISTAKNRLLKMASEVGHLGGWSISLDRRIEWTEEVAHLHGVPSNFNPSIEEAINFYMPEYRTHLQTVVDNCFMSGESFTEELQLLTRDQRLIWVKVMGQAVTNDQGVIIGIEGAIQDISLMKEAEAKIEQGLQRFHLLADAMPIVVWSALPNGEVDYVNQMLCDFTGHSAETILNDWISMVHPNDREQCIAAWSYSVQTGKDYEVDFRIRRFSGDYRWHLTRAVPIRDHAGNITKWYGSAMDIHRQRLLDQEVQLVARRLSNTLESISDAFFILDNALHFTFINTPAEKILGGTREDYLHQSLRVCVDKITHAQFLNACATALVEQTIMSFEDTWSNTGKWFDFRIFPTPDGLAVYLRDITEIKHSRELARENMERFLLVAQATQDAIWDWNLTDDTLWWNEGFEKMFGYKRDEVEKDSRSWKNRIHPDDAERIIGGIHEVIDSNIANWNGHYRFLHCDGSYRQVFDRGYLIRDTSGKAVRMLGGMIDETQRLQLEEQLRQSQRLESVGQLTGGIAHDFNNLLTVLLGNAELLKEQLHDDVRLSPITEMMISAARRGADLVHRMLAFARRQALEPKLIDLNTLVSDLCPLLKPSLGEHINIELSLNDSVDKVNVDPAQLENALLNLCLNARDAMPRGGSLTIETINTVLDADYATHHSEVIPGEYVMIAISDTGVGIIPELITKVFDPFFTTKEKGKGTGLGLAMVYGFIKQSGGHINIYSEPGQGTTVKLYLQASKEKDEETYIPPIISEIAIGGSETILLVEDDDLVRQFANAQLKKLGYSVFTAASGEEALVLLEKNPTIDLLFTDVVMTGISGRELADKACMLYPNLKVLYTSGYTENAIVHHGRLDPGVLLLGKPYRPIELANKIRLALTHKS